jgi:4-amino-4-deoxy-L-arabinose transferase-like glycosyltransferase
MPYSAFQVSRRLYLSLMVVILLVAAGLRLHLLEADAPLELSPTQELTLDGPVTIAAGRDRALFGSWDPYPGPLQPYRYYPAMNWLAYVFFSFLGVGYWQAKLISVATGFASIVLVAAFAREHFGRRVSLFSALFMASNYIYVFYNRDPMAYTTVAFGVTLSM